jgi:hypothetical protein
MRCASTLLGCSLKEFNEWAQCRVLCPSHGLLGIDYVLADLSQYEFGESAQILVCQTVTFLRGWRLMRASQRWTVEDADGAVHLAP